jgi:hypothetical protein
MTNELLLKTLREKSRLEQKLSLEVIDLIRITEDRRLFLELGFASLYDFVTKDLGYEPSSAMRRITAARLVREIPQVREKIADKTLTISVLSQAQAFFTSERQTSGQKVSTARKLEVLSQLENKSAREAKRELAILNPVAVNSTEKIREISDDLTEIKVVLDTETCEKLEALKAHLAHQNPNLSYRGLIQLLVEKTYRSVMKSRGLVADTAGCGDAATGADIANAAAQRPTSVVSSRQPPRSAIPASTRRVVWQRDQGHCQYRDPKNQKPCGSKYFLEIDHVLRRRDGGDHAPGNLRLLCRAHNAWRG